MVTPIAQALCGGKRVLNVQYSQKSYENAGGLSDTRRNQANENLILPPFIGHVLLDKRFSRCITVAETENRTSYKIGTGAFLPRCG